MKKKDNAKKSSVISSRVLEITDDYELIEETLQYTRQRKLFFYYCDLDKCPYCENKRVKGKKGKKWCREEARLEFKRRERAQTAIKDGRSPGGFGKPPLQVELGLPGMVYLHTIDKKDDDDLPQIYRLGYSESLSDYEKIYINDPLMRNTFDAIVSVIVYQPEELVQKILKRNNEKLWDEKEKRWELYNLTNPESKIAHQMAREHSKLYGIDKELLAEFTSPKNS